MIKFIAQIFETLYSSNIFESKNLELMVNIKLKNKLTNNTLLFIFNLKKIKYKVP